MNMASSPSLEEAVSELMDSPGGQLLNSARSHLRKRAMVLLGLFLTGLVVGFPIAKSIVAWLVDQAPDNVDVIVTSPVEFLMLQIQLSASFGLMLALLFLIGETTFRGVRHPVVIERFNELNLRIPRPSISFLFVPSIPFQPAAGSGKSPSTRALPLA